jgi:SnoaL-like polyketide cyclase
LLRPGCEDAAARLAQEGGVDDLLDRLTMDLAAIPDLHLDVVSRTVDETRVATEVMITGTNTGPLAHGDLGKALFGADTEEMPGTGRGRPGGGERPRR